MSNFIRLSDLDGTNGLALVGVGEGHRSGFSVSDAGDVNGDGFDDVIILAIDAYDGSGDQGGGAAYVVFGAGQGLPAEADLADLDGTNGFRITRPAPADPDGFVFLDAIGAAGDFNNDGFDDIMVATDDDGAVVRMIFGKSGPFDPTVDVEGLDGTNGFSLELAPDSAAVQLDPAGDVNADGFDDFLVSSGVFSQSTSSVVLYFGTDAPLSGTNPSISSVVFSRNQYGSDLLNASGAGDVNGDGFDDIVFGDARGGTANGDDDMVPPDPSLLPPFNGVAYVVFGSASPQSVDLDDDLDGKNGFQIPGLNDYDQLGSDVAGTGDVNGDGIDDFLIAARGNIYDYNNTPGAAVYVIFGTPEGFAAEFDLTTLDGINGFGIDRVAVGYEGSLAVNSAGDFNGDGLADIISAIAPERSSLVTVSVGKDQDFFVFGDEPFTALGASVGTAGDFNGDGIADIIIGDPLSGRPVGQFDGSYDRSGKTYIVFGRAFEASQPLSPPVESKAIDSKELESLAGVDPDALVIGPFADAEIAFMGELAKFENTIGAYLIGQNGELEEPRILIANTATADEGSTIFFSDVFGAESLQAGDRFGLFLISRGAEKNPATDLDNASGSLAFLDPVTKAPATIATTAPTLVLTSTSGDEREIKGDIFHTSGADPADPLNNLLNDGGEVQVISSIDREGNLELRFEDRSLAGASDRDFNDAILKSAFVTLPRDSVPDDPTTDLSLPIGETVANSVAFPGDRDWVRVELAPSVLYRFVLTGDGDADEPLELPFLLLFDAEGNQLVDNDFLGDPSSAINFSDEIGGTFFLSASGFPDDVGSYLLSAELIKPSEDLVAGDDSTTFTLDVGETTSGTVEFPQDEDWFRIVLEPNSLYRFSLTADASAGAPLEQVLLVLYDDAGNAVAEDTGLFSGVADLDFYEQNGGTFYLSAGSNSGNGGDYLLSAEFIRSAIDLVPDDNTTTSSLAVGDTITGSVDFPDDEDWFRIDLESSSTYRFRMGPDAGSDLPLEDTFLSLFDADGTLVSENDDTDTGLNSEIIVSDLENGIYFVSAGAFGDIVGDYLLSAELVT